MKEEKDKDVLLYLRKCANVMQEVHDVVESHLMGFRKRPHEMFDLIIYSICWQGYS